MKPTQEQVIAWAREAGMEVGAGLLMKDVYGQSPSIEHIQAAIALAYGAGRKDENEACEKLHEEMWAASVSADSTVEAFNGALKGYARAIRARREQ